MEMPGVSFRGARYPGKEKALPYRHAISNAFASFVTLFRKEVLRILSGYREGVRGGRHIYWRTATALLFTC